MADIFANLTRADKLEAIRLLEERERRIRETQIARYKPYPKQQEFHAAGLNHRERLFRAGNQLGKVSVVARPCPIFLDGRADAPLAATLAGVGGVSRDASGRQ